MRCIWWTSQRLEPSGKKPTCAGGHRVSVSVGVVRAKVQAFLPACRGGVWAPTAATGLSPGKGSHRPERPETTGRGCRPLPSGLDPLARASPERMLCLSKHAAPLEVLTQEASGTPLPLPETPPGSPGVGLVQVVGSPTTPTLLSSARPPPADFREGCSQGDRLTPALLPHHPHQAAPAKASAAQEENQG